MNKFLSSRLALKKEISKHKLVYLILFAVLAFSTYLRVYRVSEVLGFYYDQGRDALVVWDFLYKGKFFLVGPTTGIAGIFRGPFYYYLIAPFYFLGRGNPVWPSVFLALTTIAAIVILYYLGAKIQDRTTGIIAAMLAGVSFYIVTASRWLSNPTPMLILSVVMFWMMIKVTEGKRWAWAGISLSAGLSLFHFGSAGEVFYFPAILVFAIWQKKNLPERKIFLVSLALFVFTFLPQVLFDLRHDGILRNNLKKFLLEENSFKLSFWEVLKTRVNFYYDVFTNKIFHWKKLRENILLGVWAIAFFAFLPKFWMKKEIKILLLLIVAPIVGLLLFQGNYGNIYDYYLTGYYLFVILLFALVLGRVWKILPGKIYVLYFLYVFFMMNFEVLNSRLSDGLAGPDTVAFGNEKLAIDWVYDDAKDENFNVDVYVPPVIPYTYDYLFKWLGTEEYGKLPTATRVELLYTIFESDPPHPERLSAWLLRQEGIGVVEKEARFGGITAQRRTRIKTQ